MGLLEAGVRLLIPLFVFTATGILFISIVSAMNRRIRPALDRLLLGLIMGMALYMLGATVLNALFRVKLTTLSMAGTFFVTCGAMGWVVWKRRVNPLGERSWVQVLVAAALVVIFVLAMLLTPADPTSMLLMACPLTILYFGGILLCHFMPRSKSPYRD